MFYNLYDNLEFQCNNIPNVIRHRILFYVKGLKKTMIVLPIEHCFQQSIIHRKNKKTSVSQKKEKEIISMLKRASIFFKCVIYIKLNDTIHVNLLPSFPHI